MGLSVHDRSFLFPVSSRNRHESTYQVHFNGGVLHLAKTFTDALGFSLIVFPNMERQVNLEAPWGPQGNP